MIRSKECFKCRTVLPLEAFYKHAEMADGHLNKCKECAKAEERKRRADNIEYCREYDRKRAKLPHRVKAALEITRRWRSEDKRRSQCHSAVAKAINKGELVPQNCEKCGDEKTVAHHECYDKPLDVVWLCQPCHKQRHKELLNGN